MNEFREVYILTILEGFSTILCSKFASKNLKQIFLALFRMGVGQKGHLPDFPL